MSLFFIQNATPSFGFRKLGELFFQNLTLWKYDVKVGSEVVLAETANPSQGQNLILAPIPENNCVLKGCFTPETSELQSYGCLNLIARIGIIFPVIPSIIFKFCFSVSEVCIDFETPTFMPNKTCLWFIIFHQVYNSDLL